MFRFFCFYEDVLLLNKFCLPGAACVSAYLQLPGGLKDAESNGPLGGSWHSHANVCAMTAAHSLQASAASLSSAGGAQSLATALRMGI